MQQHATLGLLIALTVFAASCSSSSVAPSTTSAPGTPVSNGTAVAVVMAVSPANPTIDQQVTFTIKSSSSDVILDFGDGARDVMTVASGAEVSALHRYQTSGLFVATVTARKLDGSSANVRAEVDVR